MKCLTLIALASATTATVTAAAAPTHDIDRDGFADVVLGQRSLYFGSAKGLIPAKVDPQSPRKADLLFHALEIVGDVNGDGYADVVFGDPNCPDYALSMPACEIGSIYLFLGGPKLAPKPATSRSASAKNTGFGLQLLAPGDLDGDHRDDVIVIARDGIHVFLGTATGLAAKPITLAAGNVLAVGDVDRDGKADLLVLEPQQATLVFGGDLKRTVALPVENAATFVSAGHGDFDGDGFGDVAIAIDHPFEDKPRANDVIVYRGSAQGLVTTKPAARITQDHPRAEFGTSFASVGDLDGDKRDDLVVHASCSKFIAARSSCEAGTSYVFLGSAKGLVGKPLAALSPSRTNMSLTNTVLALGDIDGDKRPDFAIGGFIYRGAKGGLASLTPSSL